MAKIKIGSKEYEGKNIEIKKGDIYIDGNYVHTQTPGNNINITIQGDIETLAGHFGDVTINGKADLVSTKSGDVTVNGSVKGNVDSNSGDINVSGDVSGNVNTTSGDINVNTVSGDIKM